MIWRLRLMLMGKRRRILIGALVVAVLLAAAAGVALAFTRDDGGSSGETTSQTERRSVTFFLQALPPKTTVSGCAMRITYTWRPHFQANRYIGETAVIQVTGPGISGTYRKPFSARGLTFEPSPVSLAGGYAVWSATVLSIGGDAPGNRTTIQAAPPRGANC